MYLSTVNSPRAVARLKRTTVDCGRRDLGLAETAPGTKSKSGKQGQ